PTKGAVSATTSRIATIFGTKVRVISWTWVSAWTSAMPTPTIMAAATAGAEATSTVQIAYWTMSRASASFKAVLRLGAWRSADLDAGLDDDLAAALQQGDDAVAEELDLLDHAGDR